MKPLFEAVTIGQKIRIFVLSAIVIGALLASGIFLFKRQPDPVLRDPDAYHAVFLDNGQVYFGKLEHLNKEFWSLTDIYYLRAGTVQQGETVGPQIDLIKLGLEIHAPKDEMIINKQHIVFYESLGDDGEVMKLIRQHQQGSKQNF